MVKFTYQQPVPLEIDALEVLREVDQLPHMLLRIDIRGGRFPQRALHPFARIASTGKAVEAHMVEIDDDEAGIRAYFPTDVSLRGALTVGYGSELTAEIPLDRLELRPKQLDEAKIATKFHRVTMSDPGQFRPRQ